MHFSSLIRIIGFVLLWCSSVALSAGLPSSTGEADATLSQVAIPEDLSPDEVTDFVAPLGEEQVRNLLIDNLRSDAEDSQQVVLEAVPSMLELLKGVGNPDTVLGGRLKEISDSASTYFADVSDIVNNISDGQGYWGLFKILGLLVLLILASWTIESLCMRNRYNKKFPEFNSSQQDDWKLRIKYPLYYLLFHGIGLIIFAIAGHVMANILLDHSSNSHAALTRFFDLTVKARFLMILFKFLMYSPPRGLHLIDERINKSMLEISFISFLAIYYLVFHGIVMTLVQFGLSKDHSILSMALTFGLLMNPLIIGGVWLARNDIDRVLFGSAGQADTTSKPYQFAARAKIWPTVVSVSLLIVFCLWQIITIVNGRPSHLDALQQAWWIIILFPWVDLIVSSLLNRLTSLPVFQNASFQKRRSRFIFVIRNIVRLVMISILLIDIVGVLNIPILSQLGTGDREFVSILADIGAILVFGFIVWEIVQLWIEHKLPDSPEDGEVERDEGGGAGASRSETLLPLLSTTLLVVVFLAVVMSVLSTLGVQIAPLLAGAGVVGIAVGFGSQKLVQDILSGVFFLVDDAFRKGEYVVLADMGGTVEKLSVRSMQLRHHQGAVQTIPYGEIQTVKNHSRDWTTMKLELRLAYDVDLEKVRKIIKRIGKELMADEEHGRHFLAPLKSQGVMRVEESALIVRMKFTVVPGEQWVIRRVAYTRVRDALAAEGIEFARREVKVRLPEELEDLQKKDLEQKLLPEGDDTTGAKKDSATPAAMAAAAISATVAQELEGDSDPVDDR